jgi:hypothetical protein
MGRSKSHRRKTGPSPLLSTPSDEICQALALGLVKRGLAPRTVLGPRTQPPLHRPDTSRCREHPQKELTA